MKGQFLSIAGSLRITNNYVFTKHVYVRSTYLPHYYYYLF